MWYLPVCLCVFSFFSYFHYGFLFFFLFSFFLCLSLPPAIWRDVPSGDRGCALHGVEQEEKKRKKKKKEEKQRKKIQRKPPTPRRPGFYRARVAVPPERAAMAVCIIIPRGTVTKYKWMVMSRGRESGCRVGGRNALTLSEIKPLGPRAGGKLGRWRVVCARIMCPAPPPPPTARWRRWRRPNGFPRFHAAATAAAAIRAYYSTRTRPTRPKQPTVSTVKSSAFLAA